MVIQEYLILDYPHPEEEENNFKCNFLRMMETFKEEMKNPLKNWRKRQKWEEINKSLKENQEKT